jgi:hypothetical protein
MAAAARLPHPPALHAGRLRFIVTPLSANADGENDEPDA